MIHPEEVTEVDAGSSVSLACVAQGNSSISWTHAGVALLNTSQITISKEIVTLEMESFVKSVLDICTAEESHGGRYTCIATNEFGNDTINFELRLSTAEGIIMYMEMSARIKIVTSFL